jgi:two-component system response regulator FixJ
VPLQRREPGRASKMLVLLAAVEGCHRATIAAFLERRGHMVIVTETGAQSLEIAKTGKIDLVITGPAMPGIDGYELTRSLREALPHLPVILMSTGGPRLENVLLECAMTLGALETPRHVPESPGSSSVLLSQTNGRLAKLTHREQQVLDLLILGHGNKAIAYLLSISPRTVENHRARVMQKMNARNVAELVRLALSGRAATSGTQPAVA